MCTSKNVATVHSFRSIIEYSRSVGTDGNVFIQALIRRLDEIENLVDESSFVVLGPPCLAVREISIQNNLVEMDSTDAGWLRSTGILHVRLKKQQEAILGFLGQCQPLMLLSEMPGNIGDHLIWLGTERMLTISGLAFDRLPMELFNQSRFESKKGTLLIPGSGALTSKWHEWLPGLVLSASKVFERIVILPSEYEPEVPIVQEALLQKNVFPFAREVESYAKIKAYGKAELALDLALWAGDCISAQPVNSEQTPKNQLFAMRTDAGSLLADNDLKPASQNNDISLSCKNLTEFLDRIRESTEVVTDRLHVAVAAVMLNKQVHYVDPCDLKISRYIHYNFQNEFRSQLHHHDPLWLVEQGLAMRLGGGL